MTCPFPRAAGTFLLLVLVNSLFLQTPGAWAQGRRESALSLSPFTPGPFLPLSMLVNSPFLPTQGAWTQGRWESALSLSPFTPGPFLGRSLVLIKSAFLSTPLPDTNVPWNGLGFVRGGTTVALAKTPFDRRGRRGAVVSPPSPCAASATARGNLRHETTPSPVEPDERPCRGVRRE